MKDLLGREFKPGDKIAYGGRYRSTGGYVAVGFITKIHESINNPIIPSLDRRGSLSVQLIAHSGHTEAGRNTVVQRPDRAVILREP